MLFRKTSCRKKGYNLNLTRTKTKNYIFQIASAKSRLLFCMAVFLGRAAREQKKRFDYKKKILKFVWISVYLLVGAQLWEEEPLWFQIWRVVAPFLWKVSAAQRRHAAIWCERPHACFFMLKRGGATHKSSRKPQTRPSFQSLSFFLCLKTNRCRNNKTIRSCFQKCIFYSLLLTFK